MFSNINQKYRGSEDIFIISNTNSLQMDSENKKDQIGIRITEDFIPYYEKLLAEASEKNIKVSQLVRIIVITYYDNMNKLSDVVTGIKQDDLHQIEEFVSQQIDDRMDQIRDDIPRLIKNSIQETLFSDESLDQFFNLLFERAKKGRD